jgi:serine/threonine-protein kinase
LTDVSYTAQVTAAKNPEPLALGAVLAGTYRLEAVLGRGGMGVVYRASHQRLPKSYAIKILLPESGQDPDAFRRFKREAEIASSVGHPGIIEVHDFNRTDDGVPFIVMELLEGESLAELCARERPSLEQALRITREIAAALSAAHAIGVVHRDLKPQNVFLSRRGGREEIKILDFGISKIQGAQSVQTRSETLMGTPGYMSPEQARGDAKEADGRADQFALAAIAYELISGRPAFFAPGDSPYGVIYKIVNHRPPPLVGAPPSVVAAIDRALAKDADDRFPSIDAFIEALDGRAGSGAPAPTGTITESVPPQAAAAVRRQMRGAFLVSLAVTLVLVGLGIAFVLGRPPARIEAQTPPAPAAPPPEAPRPESPPTATTQAPTIPEPTVAPPPSAPTAPIEPGKHGRKSASAPSVKAPSKGPSKGPSKAPSKGPAKPTVAPPAAPPAAPRVEPPARRPPPELEPLPE